ncbi:hypothetical protein M422DRAFT_775680 [Sphaerobolus stellatus SS14]|nr:hypothetical protein M422DRAFT_775680 [Sphaerobolus stellatus SS14]
MAYSTSLVPLIPNPVTEECNFDHSAFFNSNTSCSPIISPETDSSSPLPPAYFLALLAEGGHQPPSQAEVAEQGSVAPNALQLDLYGRDDANAAASSLELSEQSLSTYNGWSGADVLAASTFESYYTGSQISNTVGSSVTATDLDPFHFPTYDTSLPDVQIFSCHNATIASISSTIQYSAYSSAITPSKRVVSRETKLSLYNIQPRSSPSRRAYPILDSPEWQLQQFPPTSSQQYRPLSEHDFDGSMGMPVDNDFGFPSGGQVGYASQTFLPIPSVPLPPFVSAPFAPAPVPAPAPFLAHPEYAAFLSGTYSSAPIPALQPTFAPYPSTSSSTLSTSAFPIPTPRAAPKAPSKRRPKASKARAQAAPSRSRPPKSKSASTCPSSIPETDYLHHLLTTCTKVACRSQYVVLPVHDYMWSNIPGDRKKRPGQPGTYILDFHSGLESAKAYLATSVKDRKAAVLAIADDEKKQRADDNEKRRVVDARKDFYCFIEGCGKCFGRSDKLARHLSSLEEHRGTKPFICPHKNCIKEYLRKTNLIHHMTAHDIAGDPLLPFPYPWNSPYMGICDVISNACVKGNFIWEDDEDVAPPFPV